MSILKIYSIAAIVGIALGLLGSCAIAINGRTFPKYDGVDPEAAPYVNQWLYLAKARGLTFDQQVTVGFANIKEAGVAGQTTYGPDYVEIDLNVKDWNRFSKVERAAVVYHELTHAYCYRDHDFGYGTPYPEIQDEDNPKKGGFFDDGCSFSIMCPYIMDDFCNTIHYSEYVEEMFNRCAPL